MKIKCSKCKEKLTASKFHRNRSTNTGFQTYCIECIRRLNQTVYKDTISASQKRFYLKNKDKVIRTNNTWIKTRDGGLFFKYQSMVRRCKYKSQQNYRWYGGIGVSVLWESYTHFRGDMKRSFDLHTRKYGVKNTSLDRKNPFGNYCKENCRWITITEQHKNTRKRYQKGV